MIHRKTPGWRVASLAAVLGLLGSGAAALILADTSSAPAGTGGSRLIDGASRPVRSPRTVPASAGIRLLQQAAAACQNTPYRGVQVVLWLGPGDSTASVIDVWHQPGGVTLVRDAPGPSNPGLYAAGPGSSSQPAALGYPDLDGVVGVSPALLDLLASNYQVTYAGRGSAAGHVALVVEVRRPGGALAARFWLDAATRLPLQREIFAGDARLVNEDAFTDLELGDSGLASMPSAAIGPPPAQLSDGSLGTLRAQGWPLPTQLPGNLSLFAATATAGSPGPVVGLSYSDGLSVVSLFVQKGLLAGPMAGWRPVVLGGRSVYAVDPGDQGNRSLAWSADGFVYTLVADAPDATVGQVVASLPAGSRPGFWQRMAHGLHRLVSWANPLHNQ